MIAMTVVGAAFTLQAGAGVGQWTEVGRVSEQSKRASDYRPLIYSRFEWVPSASPFRLDLSVGAYPSVAAPDEPPHVTLEGVVATGVDFGPHPWRHGPRVSVGLVDPAVAARPSLGFTIGASYRLGVPLGGGWLHLDPEVNFSVQSGEKYRELRLRIGYEWRVL